MPVTEIYDGDRCCGGRSGYRSFDERGEARSLDRSPRGLELSGRSPGVRTIHELEEELAANAWLSGPADTAIVFETPYDQRWEAAAALIGVDLTLISGEAGHA